MNRKFHRDDLAISLFSCCSLIKFFSVSEMILVFEAARWALQRINDRNYIPGIRLGKYHRFS